MTGITIIQITASGRRVVVQCLPNRKLVAADGLGLPPDMLVTEAAAVLKCGDCGSKDVLTYPESNRDARKGRER